MQTQGSGKRVLTGTHFMLGNHAVVEGALAAGCNFFAGYPITPANEISERMAERMPRVGGKFLQGEDELCSVYALTGAALAGAKAMTATASAGFNYMQEGIGYAVAAEIPLVIVDVQRCRGENFATQADVMQMRWGASGDHELIVLAPSSVQELFEHTIRAFNLAEKYVPPEEFVPFKAGPDGVPPLPDFGEGYHILHSLNPHDERGGIAWDPDVFEALYDRIAGKITANYDDIVQTEGFFLDDAEIILIAYGSETRPSLDAVRRARANGIRTGLLKLITVWPVAEKEIRAVAEQADTILAVEMNMGKYAREIERVACRYSEVTRVTKNRGLIHTTADIYRAIKETAN
jgi:2-oxoglutarate ferredoxin oxidoreductase subunit alpha